MQANARPRAVPPSRLALCDFDAAASRTLRPEDYPKVTIVAEAEETVKWLRTAPGKDIWLFGGGILFRSLLDAGLVDTVEVGIMPVLLGGGMTFTTHGIGSRYAAGVWVLPG